MFDFRIGLADLGLRVVWHTYFKIGYSPKEMRRNFEKLSGVGAEKLKRHYSNVAIEEINISGIRGEFITATPNPTRTVLYLHGGGYFMGSIATYRRHALRIAYRCKVRVLLIDYRLAPEYPYPAALEDAKKAFHYLTERFPLESLFIGGDSAGGGLTLATFLSLRDEGRPLPAAIFCFSPWVDLTAGLQSMLLHKDYKDHENHEDHKDDESHSDHDEDDVWLSNEHVSRWAPYYCQSNDPRDPYISPIYGKFHNSPPMLIFVGDQEILYTEGVQIAHLVKEAGSLVQLEVGEKMQHCWPIVLPFLSESHQVFRTLDCFLSQF